MSESPHTGAGESALAGPPPPLAAAVNAALDRKDAGAALRLCEDRLAEAPDDAGTLRHVALLHAASGKRGPALAAAMRARELLPDDARCWSDLGRVHAMLDEMEDAARCFAEAVEIDARYADGWHNLGTALKQLGQRKAAFTALRNALLIDPGRAATYLNLGALLIDAGQFEDALECFERAVKHDPDMPRARSRLARQMSERGKVRRAEELFRQSLGMDPDHVEGWMGLGRALEDLGEADGARGAYLNVLRRRPDHAMALGQYLALLRDDGRNGHAAGDAEDNEPARWLACAEATLGDDAVKDEAKALIGYGVAKYRDRTGDFRAAAEAGLLANAARRRATGPLDRDALTARVYNIVATYTPAFFRGRRQYGVGTDQPVFIVGLPRSGTTLTEQIMSAHPRLHGAGELPDIGRLAASMLGDDDAMWQAAASLDEPRSKMLARDYLLALRDGAPGKRLRISDKSPLNFFQLAFAALLFPGARVVHCRRAARDNALSIWMENFSPDQHYATDFGDLAFFHAQYERLMAHWREALPLRMIEVQYEDTVADLEGQARRLIAFLGAPWDDRCLDFHSHARAVQTPSRWQVRQPIYSRSVGRWKAYAAQLPELDAAFADTGSAR
ncbi:MAG: tetratricopeptide repeat protein [Alphaproteobacteria bacterium]|nr:tetratricopeptide repeat protein [Alphaproteobacteria bacterium]